MKNSILLLLWVIFIATTANSQITKTVGAGGDYPTLKNAFDAINAGTITGSVTLQITGSITDNNTAVINASGTGSASYTTLLIYPTATGYTISGAVSGPIISLNGADNVVIDGRVNATGSAKDLVITNTNTGTGSSTIRFTNSAENNTVKYCVLKGSGTNVQSGIILFSTSASGNGNDNNLIDHNDITGDPAGRPVNVICTSGTSGRENSTNTISNNNIFNFFRAASSSTGIYIYSNSIDWTVSGNSFYETTTIVPTLEFFMASIFQQPLYILLLEIIFGGSA
ncbi:MAG: hypothetical protein IPP72_16355 [Chitinophagaceae bacterium]|nr:hypothetical protein [Chitinophagaceae bacterium]